MAAATRLGKGRKYLAPEALRGRSVRLLDGRRLDIAASGVCALSGPGARDGRGPRVEPLSVHRALRDAGFVLVPADEDRER
jgi:hypothetical protein